MAGLIARSGRTAIDVWTRNPIAAGFVIGFGVVSMAAGVAFAATSNPEIGVGFDIAANVVAWARQHFEGIIAAAYERAPALVMVLAAMFVIPIIALIALLAHAIKLKWAIGHTGSRVVGDAHSEASKTMTALPHVRLRVDGQAATTLPPRGGLVRIGRHEDNDIRLLDASVHRHHALIHHTSEDEFVIVDLSGREGNGVLINGQRLPEARLSAGDRIVLGTISMTLERAA